MTSIHIVAEDRAGDRLDRVLSDASEVSRSQVQRAIRSRGVRVNGEVETRCSYRVRAGERIELALPEPEPLDVVPVDIALDFLYQDRHLVVINKPAGLVVHPGPGHTRDTLVNALLYHLDDLSGIGGRLRPGIVHRLDQDTSGVLVVAKDDVAHEGLARQFAAHSVERRYVALAAQLRGPGLAPEGRIETLFGRHPSDRKRFSGRVARGRRAITHYRVTDRFGDGAMRVECWLETGRTHQIRVHLAEEGCPLIGDAVYGGRAMGSLSIIGRQALHAYLLGFEHPVTGESLRFEGDIPDDFRRAEERLRRGGGWR